MNKHPSKEEILLRIFEIESSLHNVQDVDVLLEIILTEARKVVSADAGSIYVVEGNSLAIRHSQNDTLKSRLPKGQKLPYTFFFFSNKLKNNFGVCSSYREVCK